MKKFLKQLGTTAALTAISVNYALAALPAGVSADVAEAKSDGIELGGLMLGLAVAVGVIFWLKRKV